MWRLSSCEIWRDGGSYSTTLADGNRSVSLWLQVFQGECLEDRTHEGLFESDGTDPTVKQRLVPYGRSEQAWLLMLEQDVDTMSAAGEDIERFADFVAALRQRVEKADL